LDTAWNKVIYMGKKDKADKPKGKDTAPGQLKKEAGEKSAKSFAPGQKKDKKEKKGDDEKED
jgi:hypothetical protein